jgi:branched-chain amino acid transport system substrate-binding protein
MITNKDNRGNPRPFRLRLPLIGVLALSAATGLAACSSSGGGAGSSSSGSPYTIGLTTDLSGPTAAYGQAEEKAWSAEFNMVNAEGGVNGHKIKLITLDDQSNPATAEANATELLDQDNVIALGGSILSNICSELAGPATAKQVPMLCNATDTSDLQPVHPYVYDMFDSEITQAKPQLQWLQQHYKKTNLSIVVVDVNVPAEAAWAAAVQQLAGDYSARVVKTITESITAPPDMGSLAAEIAALKPDVVVAEVGGSSVPQLQSDLATDGAPTPIVTVATSYQAFQDSSAPNLLYEMSQVDFVNPASTQPAVKNYVEWMGKLGVTGAADLNPSNGIVYYAAAADLVAALKACGGTCTGSSVAKALDTVSVSLPGVTNAAGYGYTASNHLPNQTIAIYGWDTSSKLPEQIGGNPSLGGL